MSRTREDQDELAGLDLVGDETRRAILRALAAVRGTTAEPLSFEVLRRRVGCRDSGTFNYHLDQLRGRLVRKRDGGYELTPDGSVIVGSLSGGAFDHADERDVVDLDAACVRCGEQLVASFDGRTLVVACSEGHELRLTSSFGRLRDRPLSDVLAVASRDAIQRLDHIRSGVCARCYAAVDGRVCVDGESGVTYTFEARCDDCGGHTVAAIGMCVARHPAVVSFFYDRGVDVRARPVWQLGFALDDAVTELSTDPLRLSVAVDCAGDRLDVVLDERAAVQSTTVVTE